jgi:hypothetical protein
MNERTVKVRFPGAGPGRATELTTSLDAWLQETVVQPVEGTNTASVQVHPDQANPEAQSGMTGLLIILVEGMVAGVTHGVAEKAIDSGIIQQLALSIVRWWKRNGSPPLEVETRSGHSQVLDSATDDAENALIEALQKDSGP